MLYLAILLAGVILIVLGNKGLSIWRLDSYDLEDLGMGLLVIIIIIYLITAVITCNMPNSLKAEQKALLALRGYKNTSIDVEGSKHMLEALSYQERLSDYNSSVQFWKKHPNFDLFIWLLPRVGNRIAELEIISP